MDIDKKIGIKIRELRKSGGLSQAELAERIGLSFQQIQKYEKGATTMSVFRLRQISDALGVHLHAFLGEEERPRTVSGPKVAYIPGEETPVPPQLLSKDEIRLLRLYRKLSSNKLKQAFLKHLREFVALEKEG